MADHTDPDELPGLGSQPGAAGQAAPLPEPVSAAVERSPAHYRQARRLLVTHFREETRATALGRFILCYTLTVAPIALCLLACALRPSVSTYAIGFIVTGFAQNGLAILMHEGSHSFFHPNRRINDLLANVLVCLPIFNTVAKYRSQHFDHHRFSGTDRDPYAELYTGYRSRWHIMRSLLGDLLLVEAIGKFFGQYTPSDSRDGVAHGWANGWANGIASLVLIGLSQAALLGLYTLATGWWAAYFILWVAPLMTIPIVVNRLRTMGEHATTSGGETNRSTAPGLLEYLLIAPYGYSYHFEHHVAPGIPYYRLSEAHRLLLENDIAFTDRELTGGYMRCVARFARTVGCRQ